MTYPVGLDEIKQQYGDPAAYLRVDGGIHPSWERMLLDYVHLPEGLPLGWDRSIKVTRIRVHSTLVVPLEKIFSEIFNSGLWDRMETFDGSYAWRPSRGSQKLSTHWWGIALDLNAASNGLGEVGDMHPDIVKIFKEFGWTWGGEWGRPDPMHFQAASGY